MQVTCPVCSSSGWGSQPPDARDQRLFYKRSPCFTMMKICSIKWKLGLSPTASLPCLGVTLIKVNVSSLR